jgi:hypothetical protein
LPTLICACKAGEIKINTAQVKMVSLFIIIFLAFPNITIKNHLHVNQQQT